MCSLLWQTSKLAARQQNRQAERADGHSCSAAVFSVAQVHCLLLDFVRFDDKLHASGLPLGQAAAKLACQASSACFTAFTRRITSLRSSPASGQLLDSGVLVQSSFTPSLGLHPLMRGYPWLRTGHRPLRPGHRCPGAGRPRPATQLFYALAHGRWFLSTPAASWVKAGSGSFLSPATVSPHSAPASGQIAQPSPLPACPSGPPAQGSSPPWSRPPAGREAAAAAPLQFAGWPRSQGLLLCRDGR